VLCKSLTGFFWYQIPAPIRTLFYCKPESGVHVTEMMSCDWSMIIVDVFMRCEVILCSVVYLSDIYTTFVFRARNFHSGRTGDKKPVRRKME